ncbi:MAG: pyruvate, phosphate dikinase [Nitrospirae bacterium]|nr:pyruvate, phosphate dikinase [Nitrospirota bacterium]
MGKKRYVYYFGDGKAEGGGDMKELLGGKGAGLAEMTNLNISVPPGFTISTEACVEYYRRRKTYPPGMWEEALHALKKVERSMGARFGDPANPLLVSVRSGARASMPGMMDTVLNVGLNARTVEGLAAKTRNERFAQDSYRRFITMFGSVVVGVGRERFEEILTRKKAEHGVTLDTELDTKALKELVVQFKALVREEAGREFPEDALEQLTMAINAVFSSWYGARAVTYRRLYNIPDTWGTAVNVVAMVFGNMGETSGTGVAFTRNPATGERTFFGECLLNAQGEDVVAGIRTPLPIHALAKTLPRAYKELVATQEKLERHYRDMLDLEFTIQEGKLYMLQTRVGKRTGIAAVRIAIEMAKEGLISKREAVLRVGPEQLSQYLYPIFDAAAESTCPTIGKGLPAGPGAAAGKIALTPDRAVEMRGRGDRVILVRQETSPDDIHGMNAAVGFLTAKGGMTCVVGETRILTDRGMLTAEIVFGLLEKDTTVRILSFDSRTLRPVWRQIIAAGRRPAEAITVAISQTGRAEQNVLRLTADHKVFTIQNRRLTKKRLDAVLADEDFVTVIDQIPPLGETAASPALAYIAGAILSDGYINLMSTKGSVTFVQKPTPEKADFIAAVERAFEQVFAVPFSYVRERNTVGVLKDRQIHGSVEDRICYHREPAMRLAEIRDHLNTWVLTLDRAALLHFLAGYVDGDGTYAEESSAVRLQIVVSRNKPELLEGLALACLRLGIVPQITNNRDAYLVQIAEQVQDILSFTHRVKAEIPARQYESKCFALRALFDDVVDHVNFMGRVREGVKRNIMFGAEKIRRDILPLCPGVVYREAQSLLDSPVRSYRVTRFSGPAPTLVYNFEVDAADEMDKNFVVFSSRMTPVLVSNSHAAVVARQMGKVCVAGCEAVDVESATMVRIGSLALKEGDSLSINGFTGNVYQGDIPVVESEVIQVIQGKMPADRSEKYRHFSTLLKWADEFRVLRVRANADVPDQAKIARGFGAEGIGLCRTEHMFFAEDRVPIMQRMILARTSEEREHFLAQLLPLQKQDFIGLYREMKGFPVTIRLLDPPLHEFLPKREDLMVEIAQLELTGGDPAVIEEKRRLLARVEELHEFNPMLGLRGCRLGITMPEITRMQTRAIIEAACQVAREGKKIVPEIMIPLVGMVSEMKAQKDLIKQVAEETMRRSGVKLSYLVGTMIELPRAAVTAKRIAEEAEFFSFGTNDLTQTTFGFSRDDAAKFVGFYTAERILEADPFAVLDREGVGAMMRMAITEGRLTRPDIKLGICGEHGGEPSSVEFCHQLGLNYVSCSPYRVAIARLAAAQAALAGTGARDTAGKRSGNRATRSAGRAARAGRQRRIARRSHGSRTPR